MPLYEYRCESCEHTFELIQKFSDPPADTCPRCEGKSVKKLLSSPAIQFKGSGWYITDYARKSGTDAGKADRKSETSGSDSKAASDTSSKADSGPSTTSTKTD